MFDKNNIKLYSFDIFDTLVTRTTAYPTGIFSIMQKKLQLDTNFQDIPLFVRENFFTMRSEVESFARGYNWDKERLIDVTLNDIYSVIQRNHDLTDEQVERLKILELETEKNNILPIKSNIAELKQLIANGEKVVLISDMYLSSEQIRTLLIAVDEIFKDIKIYVSNEHNKAKHMGDMFELVAKEENVDYKDWLHFGDNEWADIKRAEEKGIITNHTPIAEFKPYERFLLEKYYYDSFYEGLMGCARAVRTNSDDKSDAYEFGASFAGPILFNYINWVIKKALDKGAKTLYFVARDGYVLKEIADTIIQKQNYNLKTKYIYGSRKAWRLPSKESIDSLLYGFFHEYEDRFSTKFLAKRLNLSDEEFTNATGLICNTIPIEKEDVYKLYDKLKEDEKFKNACISANTEKYNLVVKYMQQELNLEEDKIIFVDVSGTGRTQDILANTIKNFYNGEIISYFFHTDCVVKYLDYSKKYAYISSCNFTHFWLELMCRNIDGQTIGYKEENNTIIPILEDIDSSMLKKWGYGAYLNGLKDFAAMAIDFEIRNRMSLNSYEIFRNLFYYFFYHMDENTASIFGSIPFTLVGSEKDAQECAPKFHTKDILPIISKEIKYNVPELSFISYARSSKKYRNIKFILDEYENIWNWLFKLYFHRKSRTAYIRICGNTFDFGDLFFRKLLRMK